MAKAPRSAVALAAAAATWSKHSDIGVAVRATASVLIGCRCRALKPTNRNSAAESS